jgi:hypothetical protein
MELRQAGLAGLAAGDGHRARDHHRVLAGQRGSVSLRGKVAGDGAGEDQGDNGDAEKSFHDLVPLGNFFLIFRNFKMRSLGN